MNKETENGIGSNDNRLHVPLIQTVYETMDVRVLGPFVWYVTRLNYASYCSCRHVVFVVKIRKPGACLHSGQLTSSAPPHSIFVFLRVF